MFNNNNNKSEPTFQSCILKYLQGKHHDVGQRHGGSQLFFPEEENEGSWFDPVYFCMFEMLYNKRLKR